MAANDNAKHDRPGGGASEEERVLQLAERSDLSLNQARELIRRHGNDPKKLEEAARIFRAES